MLNNKLTVCIWLFISLCLLASKSFAQSYDDNPVGQTIQINTRFESFLGKPSWLLIIRDVDNGINIPYLFDIKRGTNFWVAFTYSRNYLITVSNLQISTYSRYNRFKKYRLNNFCHLESNGRIIHGESIFVTVTGNLTANPNSVDCDVSRYADTRFTIAPLAPETNISTTTTTTEVSSPAATTSSTTTTTAPALTPPPAPTTATTTTAATITPATTTTIIKAPSPAPATMSTIGK